MDQRPDTIDEDVSPAMAAGSHSVAADPLSNQVYVSGNNAAMSICPGGHGCIAIFMSANHDQGICGGKETAFTRKIGFPVQKLHQSIKMTAGLRRFCG